MQIALRHVDKDTIRYPEAEMVFRVCFKQLIADLRSFSIIKVYSTSTANIC
jgi:hypothetical protein